MKPQSSAALSFFFLLVSMMFFSCSEKATEQNAEVLDINSLKKNFEEPPEEIKPWVYWYWINNHISKKGITRDLEKMADLGIGAALIGNIYLDDISQDGKTDILSNEWAELTQHAIREGGRLGVDIGLFNSPGWSQSGGPWNDESNSMRYLDYHEFKVQGGQTINLELDNPEGYFEDISLLALPVKEGESFTNKDFQLSSSGPISNLDHLLDGDLTTQIPLQHDELAVDFETETSKTLRSLKIFPSPSTFLMDVVLKAEVEGQWKEVRSFKFDRRNDMDQLGFQDYPPVVVSFSPVTAKKFRLEFQNITPTLNNETIGISEVSFSSIPHLEYYIEKQMAKMHQTPLPLDDAYRWPNQPEIQNDELILKKDGVINISEHLSSDGILNWEAPEGEWTIYRFGMASTGIKNAPAAPNATGLEVDKINKEALQRHFQAFVGAILDSMPAEERTAFKYVVADSYETGSQNWTDGFDESFKEIYGYDPKEFLPVLAGRVVESVDISNRFLWDLRRIVADKVAYEYVGGLRELCQENGLELWLENYGHWGFPSEFLMYGGQSDFVGGEFWAEGDLGSIELKAASSAGHIYGKNRVSAESYTASGMPFMRHPGMLKKRGDWSFSEGVTHPVLHVYIQQAYDSVPGVNAWFGTEFNRNNTWFDKAGPWIDYQRRSQLMLQEGTYVADIAYFIGEDAPKMTGTTKPNPPEGYSFDYINAEVIKDRVTVENGRITLPNGISYKVLVLPEDDSMRPELLEKIQALVKEGAVVMGNPPRKSPSLEDFPAADQKVMELSKEMWGEDFGSDVINYGRGKIFPPSELEPVLSALEVAPDFKTSQDQPVLWIHRELSNGHIYFLSNQSDEKISFDASFRVKGMQPSIWDATTGSSRMLPVFTQNEEHTSLPLELEPAESAFVVFTEEALNQQKELELQNFGAVEVIQEIDTTWNVHFQNSHLGIDQNIVMNQLKDWTELADQELKYFSGSAVYRTHFYLNEKPSAKKIFLDIGKVNVLANIKLNNKVLGGLWTYPWRIEVTDYLEEGSNELEIEVTNLWVNQLIGDSDKTGAEQKTWTLTGSAYSRSSELQPSGLDGPVNLVRMDEVYGKKEDL